MKLPEFVYAKAFWEFVSITLAGVLGLLAFFNVVDASWAIPSAAILTWVLGLLRMFGVEPELLAKRLKEQNEVLKAENQKLSALYNATTEKKAVKKVNK